MIPYEPLSHYVFGSFKMHTEALAMNLAFILLVVYVHCHLKKEKFPKHILDWSEYAKFIGVVIFSALAGGRIWYFAMRWEGWETLIRLFDLRLGGLVSVGMLVGGAVGLLLYAIFYAKYLKLPNSLLELTKFVDVLVLGTAIWIFVYRLFACNIFGWDAIGKETTVPWAYYWVEEGIARHPIALYLSLSALLIFTLLNIFLGAKKTKETFGRRVPGEVSAWFAILYFFNRFWIEFLRSDQATTLGLSTIQWASLALFLCAVVIIVDIYLWLTMAGCKTYEQCTKLLTSRKHKEQQGLFKGYRLYIRKIMK